MRREQLKRAHLSLEFVEASGALEGRPGDDDCPRVMVLTKIDGVQGLDRSSNVANIAEAVEANRCRTPGMPTALVAHLPPMGLRCRTGVDGLRRDARSRPVVGAGRVVTQALGLGAVAQRGPRPWRSCRALSPRRSPTAASAICALRSNVSVPRVRGGSIMCGWPSARRELRRWPLSFWPPCREPRRPTYRRGMSEPAGSMSSARTKQ